MILFCIFTNKRSLLPRPPPTCEIKLSVNYLLVSPLSLGADETTVASPSNAINVTNDGGNTEQEDEEGDEGEDNQDEDDDDVADDESDYSYQYEDDDGYSGFLIPLNL